MQRLVKLFLPKLTVLEIQESFLKILLLGMEQIGKMQTFIIIHIPLSLRMSERK